MKPARRSSRRAFLAGRSAVEALQDLADQLDPDTPLPPPAAAARELGRLQLQISRRAMACEFEVFFDTVRYPQGTAAAMAALDMIEALEQQLSVYRGDSEVSRLNQRAAAGRVRVEERLYRLLRRAVELSQQTDGAFDITSAPLSKVWGFYRREGRVPSGEALASAIEVVGSDHLEFHEADRAVSFDRQGVEINLGSIGKGFALDRAAGQVKSAGVHDFLMHGGASSILARGSSSEQSTTDAPGWLIGIRHPARPGKRLLEIVLQDRGLGTSGSAVQHFHHRGKKYGHILDPRSGWPAEANLSSTVVAPTAADADALATAFFVMSVGEIERFCSAHSEVGALVVAAGARRGGIELHAFNLDDATWWRVDDEKPIAENET